MQAERPLLNNRKRSNRKASKQLGITQSTLKQASSFCHLNNDPMQTPQHPRSPSNKDFIHDTRSSLKTKQQLLSCANKLCANFVQSMTEKVQINMQTLCTDCQQQFKNQSYCLYCKQIYTDTTDDGKEWIMCDDCQRWVHCLCADVNTKENPNVVFKCIKCRKIEQPQGQRRNNQRGGTNGKVQKKKNYQFLNSIGFQWELSTDQIASDMELIKKHLTMN